MKLRISVFFLILFFQVKAQDSCFPYNAGGFGHFYIGPSFFPNKDLQSYLERSDVLNTDLPVRAGTISGGEGAGLLGRFIIGGGGFGESILRHTTDSSRVNISFGGGYFKFGYVLCSKSSNFGYAYGGVGWGGYNVHLENLTDESPINFNHRAPLQPGFKSDYSFSCNFYDFGISYKKMFLSSEESTGIGGFMLGFDLGCMITVPSGDWGGQKDEVVSGPPLPGALLNPYLRLTIGGGGFGLK